MLAGSQYPWGASCHTKLLPQTAVAAMAVKAPVKSPLALTEDAPHIPAGTLIPAVSLRALAARDGCECGQGWGKCQAPRGRERENLTRARRQRSSQHRALLGHGIHPSSLGRAGRVGSSRQGRQQQAGWPWDCCYQLPRRARKLVWGSHYVAVGPWPVLSRSMRQVQAGTGRVGAVPCREQPAPSASVALMTAAPAPARASSWR